MAAYLVMTFLLLVCYAIALLPIVAIALIASWLVAVLFTPYIGV